MTSPPQPLTPTSKTLRAFARTQDATQVRTGILVEGQRTESPLPIPALAPGVGIVALPVGDSSMFKSGAFGPVRIGTQQASYTDKDAINPAVNPPGSLVTVAAAPGATVLSVQDAAPFAAASHGLGVAWAFVGNQYLRYTGTAAGQLTGIPASGPGAITAPISVNAEVSAQPFLYGIASHEPVNPRVFHAQAAGQAVVLVVREEHAAGRLHWRQVAPVTNGVRDQLVQDGRLSQSGASARAIADLEAFAFPLEEANWVTVDMNADVGRRQATNFPITTTTFLITAMTMTFPLQTQPPLRTCHGTTKKVARVTDMWIADPQ